jgi:Dolichyl-phosphate-mannose-protein mannosyltransferase
VTSSSEWRGNVSVERQPPMDAGPEKKGHVFRLTKIERILVLLFLLTLPLCNPWVRGDGVGYYAFARSSLIEHNLDFSKDWLEANSSFRMGRLDADGNIVPTNYTATGHLENHFSVGPAILWAPFLVVAHCGVVVYDTFGGHVAADGFSRPYIIAMALATALYGFLALWISFRLAREYMPERWAFLATLAIWFASSLPVYMYFNPSWSHAHSAFTVALFVWYWNRTRLNRSIKQWAILGTLGGLMMNVYYVNGILLLLPLVETLAGFWEARRTADWDSALRLFLKNILFALIVFLAFLPTFVTKKIIYGSYLNFGYGGLWISSSPAFFKVLYSSEHGLFSWTPIVFLAIIGLFLFRRYDRKLSFSLIAVFVFYLYTIGCYVDWAGLSSFGNRFFVSLTSLFILGLAAFFDFLERAWTQRRAAVFASVTTTLFILWNLGMIFQWGTHLIPARGPISFREAAYNQVAVVPKEAAQTLKAYFMRRKLLMDHIEQQDVHQLKQQQGGNTPGRE